MDNDAPNDAKVAPKIGSARATTPFFWLQSQTLPLGTCVHNERKERLRVVEQIEKTQAEPQWIVAQRLLSALTIPGFG